MRGKNTDYFYLQSEIIEILKVANVPMSALGINFQINNKLDKIVDLNTIKDHLEVLVKNEKLHKFDKDNIIHYKLNPKTKSR